MPNEQYSQYLQSLQERITRQSEVVEKNHFEKIEISALESLLVGLQVLAEFFDPKTVSIEKLNEVIADISDAYDHISIDLPTEIGGFVDVEETKEMPEDWQYIGYEKQGIVDSEIYLLTLLNLKTLKASLTRSIAELETLGYLKRVSAQEDFLMAAITEKKTSKLTKKLAQMNIQWFEEFKGVLEKPTQPELLTPVAKAA